jgi:hypothetical protein
MNKRALGRAIPLPRAASRIAKEKIEMTVSAKAVRFDDDSMWVELSDARTIGIPFAWFPRLLYATPEQRERVEIGRMGLHWEELDEDISIAGLLAGRGDRTRWGDGRENGPNSRFENFRRGASQRVAL